MTKDTRDYFTADTAQKLFSKHTGYDFHTTVPGQLLARMGVRKLGYKEDGRAAYDVQHWRALWHSMFKLALNRHRYGHGPDPVECVPPEPPQETEKLLNKQPIIDYASQWKHAEADADSQDIYLAESNS